MSLLTKSMQVNTTCFLFLKSGNPNLSEESFYKHFHSLLKRLIISNSIIRQFLKCCSTNQIYFYKLVFTFSQKIIFKTSIYNILNKYVQLSTNLQPLNIHAEFRLLIYFSVIHNLNAHKLPLRNLISNKGGVIQNFLHIQIVTQYFL